MASRKFTRSRETCSIRIERDEPERKQLFDRKVVEELNTMLEGVVTHGTGRRAQLDFTYSVGKTGTSSNFRDGWFMGFTGQYVVGVWMGNDDFTPMARVTGGSFPAQTWHNFMVLAHDTDNIPEIPVIPLHPVQVAEQERLAQLQQAVASTPMRFRPRARKRQGYVERDAPDPGEDRRSAEGSAVAQPSATTTLRPRRHPRASRRRASLQRPSLPRRFRSKPSRIRPPRRRSRRLPAPAPRRRLKPTASSFRREGARRLTSSLPTPSVSACLSFEVRSGRGAALSNAHASSPHRAFALAPLLGIGSAWYMIE